jgi:hypothetical protein
MSTTRTKYCLLFASPRPLPRALRCGVRVSVWKSGVCLSLFLKICSLQILVAAAGRLGRSNLSVPRSPRPPTRIRSRPTGAGPRPRGATQEFFRSVGQKLSGEPARGTRRDGSVVGGVFVHSGPLPSAFGLEDLAAGIDLSPSTEDSTVGIGRGFLRPEERGGEGGGGGACLCSAPRK